MVAPTSLAKAAATTTVVAAVALVLSAGPGDSKTTISAAKRLGKAPVAPAVGSASAGREVFRFETFGNEGFRTDAMLKGMIDVKVTPLQALKIGLLVAVDAVPKAMRDTMMAELKTDLSPQNAPMLHDPLTRVKLIEANALVGIVPKDSNGDGRIDIATGDKVGVSCAICHTVTDKSVHEVPGAGSIGRIIDGPFALILDVGKLLATAANSRAYYPSLQLTLGGKTIGRAPKGLEYFRLRRGHIRSS